MKEKENDRPLTDEQARTQLYEILHRNLPRKQALERVVETGSNYLGINHGHITDIEEADGQWEVISSTDGPTGEYPEGLSNELSDSYCRRTIRQPTPLALHDAEAQGWANDRAYRIHQLDTYVGARIEAFGEPYGTVCFVESGARAEPFSEAELVFVELAGQILRKILEESHRHKDLTNRDRLISVLTRVLRHNLRNDLNVVQGYAEIIGNRTSDDMARMASSIRTKTTDLLSLAEKGRTLEKLTKSVPVARPTDVVPIVEETASEVQSEYPSVDIAVDTPERAMAFAAPQLSEAVYELLENAAEYGGTEAIVDVERDSTADEVTVSVADDGPGLPEDQRRVLTGVDETALEHGDGLGLALVFWIVTNLDGGVDVSVSSRGTTIELRFQRAASILSGTD